MFDLKQVTPYYQPIISADTHSIYGYEVLGRISDGTKATTLGPFFHHPDVSDEDKLTVDTHIQNLVFENMIKQTNSQLFFINVHANHLMKENSDSLIERLFVWQKRGLHFERLVIEMTEHNFHGDITELTEKLAFLKSLGIKIALDDVGIGASNLDRVGILEPDILKVDIHSLKNNEPTISYHGVMSSLSYLARKIGADLLFEAIENNHDLHYSWRNNGRFFQGYFLSRPNPQLLDENVFKAQFKDKIREFIQLEKKKLNVEFTLSIDLNCRLQHIMKKIHSFESLDQTMIMVASQLGDICYRMYITDEDGFQQTSNAVKINGNWILKTNFKGMNWSWRPYFLENIIKMEQENKGILSDIYSDIETGDLIRTFSFPISKNLFLFIDIPIM